VGRLSIKEISNAGLIAAAYTVLALAFLPISFGVYQVRIAEALTVLPFLTRAAVPGLFVGVLLANIFGGMGWVDIVVGPLITLVAAILTRQARLIPTGKMSLTIAILPPILMWLGGAYLLTGAQVTLRTVLGAVLSILVIAILSPMISKASFEDQPGSRLNLLKGGSVLLLVLAAWLMNTATGIYFIVLGGVLMLATLATYVMLLNSLKGGFSTNILIAPLPPVLLNAFGVSIYLAPILGFNYWFSVQMIGLGQLIACYLIGLTLLKILGKREIFI